MARAATANVNPRTRLSHMTPFSGHDWCTRERCRPMMQNSQNSQNSLPMTSRILRRAREFPRIFRQSQTGPRARAHQSDACQMLLILSETCLSPDLFLVVERAVCHSDLTVTLTPPHIRILFTALTDSAKILNYTLSSSAGENG